jgi:Mor family transcriptional regulator
VNTTTKEWLEEINLDDLPEPYREMSKAIGIKPTLEIARLYQGTGFYLPKLDSVINKIRDKKIKEEFDGKNYKDLAIKYGLTDRWVRQIVDSDIVDNQVSLFDKAVV